jgi:hypothetical protein
MGDTVNVSNYIQLARQNRREMNTSILSLEQDLDRISGLAAHAKSMFPFIKFNKFDKLTKDQLGILREGKVYVNDSK